MKCSTNKIVPWWLLVIAAMVTVALLAPYFFLFIFSMWRDPTWDHLITLLFLWQTQTGAALAIVAAVIGGGFILYQTTEARRLDQGQRIRKIDALRGLLTHDLVELTDYCKQGGETLVSHLGSNATIPAGRPHIRAAGLDIPSLPLGVVGRVASLIENCEPDQMRPFVLLLQRTQIQHARAKSMKFRAGSDKGVARTEIVSCLVDTAEIYARCSKLFSYARAETLKAAESTTADDVRQAVPLMLWATDLSAVDEINGAIDRRAAHVQEPWPAT